jgi:RNA polymerase sigma factor (sigma-70 family)
MYREMTESQLVEHIGQGEAAALEQLYDRFEKPLYSFAYRMLRDHMQAEEALQELFVRVWKTADRYQADQGQVSSWLFAILRNIAIDFLRKKGSRPQSAAESEDLLTKIGSNAPSTEQRAEFNWMQSEIASAIRRLKHEQQEVIDLIYFQGYTHHEVSERRGIPLGTVKSRVRLAMKHLKEHLHGLPIHDFSAKGVQS